MMQKRVAREIGARTLSHGELSNFLANGQYTLGRVDNWIVDKLTV
jgi:hypothetical protein